MAIKTVYQFEINKEIEVEKTSETDAGKLITKVIEKKPVKFAIRKPNRALIDSAEMFYSIEFNKAVQAGLLPRALFAKRLDNDKGVFSDAQIEEQKKLYNRFIELNKVIVDAQEKKEEDRNEDEKKNLTESLNEYLYIQQRLSDYEAAQNSLFDNTAENRAKIKVMMWYSLFLSYIENDKGEFVSLYKGETYEEKLASYDEMEEKDDKFLISAAQKFNYFVTALYLGRANSEADFKALEDRLTGTLNPPVEEVEEKPKE